MLTIIDKHTVCLAKTQSTTDHSVSGEKGYSYQKIILATS